jgi:hypothetical protein
VRQLIGRADDVAFKRKPWVKPGSRFSKIGSGDAVCPLQLVLEQDRHAGWRAASWRCFNLVRDVKNRKIQILNRGSNLGMRIPAESTLPWFRPVHGP